MDKRNNNKKNSSKHDGKFKFITNALCLIIIVGLFGFVTTVLTNYFKAVPLNTTATIVMCGAAACIICWLVRKLNHESYVFKLEVKQLKRKEEDKLSDEYSRGTEEQQNQD